MSSIVTERNKSLWSLTRENLLWYNGFFPSVADHPMPRGNKGESPQANFICSEFTTFRLARHDDIWQWHSDNIVKRLTSSLQTHASGLDLGTTGDCPPLTSWPPQADQGEQRPLNWIEAPRAKSFISCFQKEQNVAIISRSVLETATYVRQEWWGGLVLGWFGGSLVEVLAQKALSVYQANNFARWKKNVIKWSCRFMNRK